MKQEEIEKAAVEYAEGLSYSMEAKHNMCQEDFQIAFKLGADFVNKYWQEKTRWKSLTTEPPTEFGENKRILINHINGGACIYTLYSNANVEYAIDMGFIEWKEIY